MKYRRFEDLPCWQKARELCRVIWGLIQKESFKRDFDLRNQIWKSAGSVMDNIAEGFDDGSTREFIRFLKYSQRSSSEVQSQLYRAIDCGHIDEADFNRAYLLAEECRKQVKSFRSYLKSLIE